MAGKFVGDREVNGTHGTRSEKKKKIGQALGKLRTGKRER